jgi:hypothetical protein
MENSPLWIPLDGGFKGKIDPEKLALADDNSIEKLVKGFEKNVKLRSFFVDKSFLDVFKGEYLKFKNNESFRVSQDIQLCEFVRAARVVPLLNPKSSDQKFLAFFTGMQKRAGKIFHDGLDKSFDDVCIKSQEIGLLEPKILSHQNFALIPAGKDCTPEDNIFYEVSPAFWELWVNTEDRKMMELWIYWILKEHLKGTNFSVFHSVPVIPETPPEETMCELLSESEPQSEEADGEKDDRVTEIDCLITEDNKAKVFIECKSGKINSSDILKLYGSLKLFGASFGLLLGGKEVDDLFANYPSIRIFTNVFKNQDFPSELRNFLSGQLGIN